MSVFFQPRTALTKGAVEPTARGIAQAVSAVPVGTVDRTADVKVHWQALPPGIAHISIRRSIDGVDKLWHADAGGWVAQIGPEDVRAVLFTKNRMHAAARQRCDELWLVIVNDVFSIQMIGNTLLYCGLAALLDVMLPNTALHPAAASAIMSSRG